MKVNIIKPSFVIEPHVFISSPIGQDLDYFLDKIKAIEYYGRISHRSEDKQTEDSWKRFIPAVVIQKGDWSITEHEKVTVELVVDRGITHEIVRHRMGSYTQESTRFVNYGKREGINVICPFPSEEGPRFEIWKDQIGTAYLTYDDLLNEGSTPQLARSVLPNALAAKIIITYNLRSWRHFFIMRVSKETHPQMKEITVPLLNEFKRLIPLLYDDIIPETRQIELMSLGK